MESLGALVRGAAIGVFVLLAVADWRDRPNSAFGWAGSLFSVSAIAFLLVNDPMFAASRPFVRLIVGVLALSAPFFFWLQANLIFDDGFRLGGRHWVLLVVCGASGVLGLSLKTLAWSWLHIGAAYLFRVVSLMLVASALWTVWQGRTGDLIERRATARVRLVAISGVAIATILISSALSSTGSKPSDQRLFAEAAGLLMLGLAYGVVLLRVEHDLLPPLRDSEIPRSSSERFGVSPGETDSLSPVDDGDVRIVSRLDRLMRGEEMWRKSGLTISDLADRVGTPEYRLRRVINKKLGFRNFTAFINEYRLSAAATRLADQTQNRIPILTIALELGWGSIGPFNRAFRARFGMPPSDYRRECVAASSTEAGIAKS